MNLEAREEKRREEIQVELQEREYTRKQLEDMLPGLREALYKEAAGENPSLDEVTEDLYFPSSIPGYPFEITWECENYELVQSDGKVRNERTGRWWSSVRCSPAMNSDGRNSFPYGYARPF